MTTFLIGLVILIVGGALYGHLCQHVFRPDDRKRYFWIPLIPLTFYSFITCSYILSARIGLSLPYGLSIGIGVVFAILVVTASIRIGCRQTDPKE